MYRIIKLDDLAIHFNMSEKLCLLCRETFTESHLHSVKRHMYRKHRTELDSVLQRKTNDPPASTGFDPSSVLLKSEDRDTVDSNELIDVVEIGEPMDLLGQAQQQSGISL
jgi:hypothetical protein